MVLRVKSTIQGFLVGHYNYNFIYFYHVDREILGILPEDRLSSPMPE